VRADRSEAERELARQLPDLIDASTAGDQCATATLKQIGLLAVRGEPSAKRLRARAYRLFQQYRPTHRTVDGTEVLERIVGPRPAPARVDGELDRCVGEGIATFGAERSVKRIRAAKIGRNQAREAFRQKAYNEYSHVSTAKMAEGSPIDKRRIRELCQDLTPDQRMRVIRGMQRPDEVSSDTYVRMGQCIMAAKRVQLMRRGADPSIVNPRLRHP
jgi:hypothetical protein